MFTDKHFPPTFLSHNPSLRDMVKDQTDFDRRLTEISKNVEKGESSLNGRPASSLHQTSTGPNTSKQSHLFGANPPLPNVPCSNSSAHMNLCEARISEERAIRASQRRLLKSRPTTPINCDFGSRCSTPNMLTKSACNNYNTMEEGKLTSPFRFPELSYGRITPSRNLVPKLENSHRYGNVNLRRPSEYYNR